MNTKNKSGISLIFVLAVMLLLLTIGVSALTAAGLNHRASFAQRDRNQTNLYVNAMMRTISTMLISPPNGNMTGNTLGESLLIEAFNEALRDIPLQDAFAQIEDGGTLLNSCFDLLLEISAIPDRFQDVYDNISISADMDVFMYTNMATVVDGTVEITLTTGAVRTRTTFELSGGYLMETDTGLSINNPGTWRIIRNETI